MLTIESTILIEDVTGHEITDFLLACSDEAYSRWWPGTHLRFHPVRLGGGPNHEGDVILMDEYIGRRRLTLTAVVTEAVPGRRIVWQVCRGVRLPVRLLVELQGGTGAVMLRHRITAGFTGVGRLLDPLFRLSFPDDFRTAMEEHVETEFRLLRQLLLEARSGRGGPEDTAT